MKTIQDNIQEKGAAGTTQGRSEKMMAEMRPKEYEPVMQFGGRAFQTEGA